MTDNKKDPVKKDDTVVKDAGAISYDLDKIKTKSNKTIKDFTIPDSLFKDDKELIKLVLESEAMNDGEKQYWFNLTKVMNKVQIEKLYDILRRERQKLNEIRGIKPKVDPEEAKRRSEEMAKERASKMEELEKKEAEHLAKEKESNDGLLDSLDW